MIEGFHGPEPRGDRRWHPANPFGDEAWEWSGGTVGPTGANALGAALGRAAVMPRGPDGNRHEYTYLTSALLRQPGATGPKVEPIADLPLMDVTFSFGINTPGTFSGTLPVPVFYASEQYLKATEPGRTALYVFRDGVPLWGGIIWKRTVKSSDRNVIIEAQTFDSYAFHRICDETLRFVRDLSPNQNGMHPGTDQIEMWRIVWMHMLKNRFSEQEDVPPAPGVDHRCDLGIKLDPLMSGVLRGRSFEKWDFKTYGEHLTELAKLYNGFEWTAGVSGTRSGEVQRYIRFGYPKIGRPWEKSRLVWEYPSNLNDYTWDQNTDEAVTRAFLLGYGEGDLMTVVKGQNDAIMKAPMFYPLLDKTYDHKSQYSAQKLASYALKYLDVFRPPLNSTSFGINPNSTPDYGGAWRLGDEVRVIINDDMIPLLGLEKNYFDARIKGVSVRPGDEGAEEITPEIEPLTQLPLDPPEDDGDLVPEKWPGPTIDPDPDGAIVDPDPGDMGGVEGGARMISGRVLGHVRGGA